jgi:hypothetical protein
MSENGAQCLNENGQMDIHDHHITWPSTLMEGCEHSIRGGGNFAKPVSHDPKFICCCGVVQLSSI